MSRLVTRDDRHSPKTWRWGAIALSLLWGFGLPAFTTHGLVFSTAQALAVDSAESSEELHQAHRLMRQGLAAYEAGEIHSALDQWQAALNQYRSAEDSQGESFALGNLGIAYQHIGDYVSALETHQQALLLMESLGNEAGAGQVLGNLGNVYEALGNYDQAIASFEASLEVARRMGDRTGEVILLSNLGAVYATQGDPQGAIAIYSQSLELARILGDRAREGHVQLNMGVAHHALGATDEAAMHYQQSLAIAREASDLVLEGKALGSLGMVAEDRGNLEVAIELHQQSLAIAQQVDDPRTIAQAANNLGHALYAANQLDEAETQLRAAIHWLEDLRPEDLPDLYNISVFDTQVLTYNLLKQILVAQGEVEAALEIAERGRARAFVDLLVRRQAAAGETATPDNVIESARLAPNIEGIRAIAREQNATLVEYSLVPASDFKVQGKQRGTAAELMIWVVSPAGEITFRHLNFSDPVLLESLQADESINLKRLVVNSHNPTRAAPALKQLHQLLIAPIHDALPTDPEAKVIFVPQDFLFLLPFPALTNPENQYLIEQHTLLTAPSIQVLALTRHHRQRISAIAARANATAVVVGNPEMPMVSRSPGAPAIQLESLPAAELEARAIAKLLNTEPLIGSAATKAAVAQTLPTVQRVHLATHSLLDYGQAENSETPPPTIPGAIALAPSAGDSGLLTSSDIIRLNLNADLVVLSACNTGRGTITGDGIVGLSRSFIAAGTASIVASLWEVPDEPTAALMTAFYQNLIQGMNKAQALRQAMLSTREDYSQVTSWAAFTLIGESE
ncbi:MAG: CHAT domain-containing tetratricopeptide repeat protein [Elainellaceae cyanobacterium]